MSLGTRVRSIPDQHLRDRRLELGRDALSRWRIYLDTWVWIRMRDHSLARHPSRDAADLLALLEEAVTAGQAICPLEANTVRELLGQLDQETRRATARLMDSLSRGLCLASPEERRRAEFLYFLRKHWKGDATLHEPRELVWTTVGSAFGEVTPENEGWRDEERTAIQVGFRKHLETLRMTDILSYLDVGPPAPVFDSEGMARKLNEEKFRHAHEARTFIEMRDAELRGALDVNTEEVQSAIEYFYETTVGLRMTEKDRSDLSGALHINRLILAGFKSKRMGTDLPSVWIPAVLHAAIRWDRGRKYRSTDWRDIEHATAALPYCDVFITDGAMASSITARHVGLDALYGARVNGNLADAFQGVRSLLAGPGKGGRH